MKRTAVTLFVAITALAAAAERASSVNPAAVAPWMRSAWVLTVVALAAVPPR